MYYFFLLKLIKHNRIEFEFFFFHKLLRYIKGVPREITYKTRRRIYSNQLLAIAFK